MKKSDAQLELSLEKMKEFGYATVDAIIEHYNNQNNK